VNAPSTVRGRVKNRILGFQGPHADPDPAGSAAGWLAPRPGILHVEALDTWRVDIWYDLARVRLQDIERGLVAEGFPLDTSLLSKLRRALYHYSEEAQYQQQYDALGSGDSSQRLHVKCAKRHGDGPRDPRVGYWRHYW
jgi:hypothetical protein